MRNLIVSNWDCSSLGLSLARQPAGLGRQPTYFHLLAQMKVGKAKGLNTSHLAAARGNRPEAAVEGRARLEPAQRSRTPAG
ncbi:MAG: hypothetical protein JSR59_05100 [Proteobacteria bacterium]|nr:hypothetical protein [Pseudomonadota bacterium]